MSKTLFIIRGVSGSGKTTLAEVLQGGSVPTYHAEADQFFTVNGEYRFEPTMLKQAHEDCITRVDFAMMCGDYTRVIVSNTFTRVWEFQPYLDMARARGWRVSVIHMETRHANNHGVPEESVQRMADRWEPFNETPVNR